MGRYEQMANQFGDAKMATNYLPKNMRSRLGQSPEDLGSKILTVTKAVEAGATALQSPKAPAPEAKPAVAVNIPYIPIGLAVLAVIGVFVFMRKK